MNSLRRLALLLAVLIPLSAKADAEGAKLLFKEKGVHLTLAQKRHIFQFLGVRVAADRQNLVDADCGRDAHFNVDITDLNQDKTPEVVIVGGNSCTSGTTGSSIWLFVKDAKGVYRPNLDSPATGYEVMKHRSKGYPDLLIDGMGVCSEIWRWNGKKYQPVQNAATADAGCDGR